VLNNWDARSLSVCDRHSYGDMRYDFEYRAQERSAIDVRIMVPCKYGYRDCLFGNAYH
jgi:hypothetical protein